MHAQIARTAGGHCQQTRDGAAIAVTGTTQLHTCTGAFADATFAGADEHHMLHAGDWAGLRGRREESWRRAECPKPWCWLRNAMTQLPQHATYPFTPLRASHQSLQAHAQTCPPECTALNAHDHSRCTFDRLAHRINSSPRFLGISAHYWSARIAVESSVRPPRRGASCASGSCHR